YLTEKYDTGYYSYYFIEEIKPHKLLDSFVQRISSKVQWLLTTIPCALEIQMIEKEFSAIEDKRLVSLHKFIERRNGKLAKKAKRRDKYICQVCGFNFLKTYGDKGLDFAEAHHIVALSTLKRKEINTPADLITVCANCHRILHHRMEGKADDYKKLQRLVKRQLLKE
ncbi:MAG: HNH endonuclease, partial [Pedobacter sp.]